MRKFYGAFAATGFNRVNDQLLIFAVQRIAYKDDAFIQEELFPFYKRTSEAFWQNHHAFYSVVNSFLSGKKNHVGMRVTENEKVLGEYTVHVDGASIFRFENGLSSEIHTLFGIVRPYVII